MIITGKHKCARRDACLCILYVASCGGRGQSFIAWPDNDNDKPIILRPKEREDWQTNETVTFSRRIKRTEGDATRRMD